MGNSLNRGSSGVKHEGQGSEPSARASLTRLEGPGGIQTVEVKWNPASYRLRRASQQSTPERLGAGEGAQMLAVSKEEFSTELFLDTTGEGGVNRNAQGMAEILRGWMDPLPGGLLPSKVLFLWGTFRFVGFIEEMDEEWIRFDPDGTPVLGRLRLLMRN